VLLDVFLFRLFFLSLTDGIDHEAKKFMKATFQVNSDDFIAGTSFKAWR